MGNYNNHKNTLKTLKMIEGQLNESPDLYLDQLDRHQTALITIDVINGFLKNGALASDRVKANLGRWIHYHEQFEDYRKVFFLDAHPEDSVEFETYPPHCIEGEWESEIVTELLPYMETDAWTIAKNSTNGFLTHEFMAWLAEHAEVNNFVIIGDCTDICIKQFALTLKAYFNENNSISRIIVPIDGTETFDLSATLHDGNLMNLMSYYEMKNNGIEIVKSIIE